jgi:hypothetical protein
MKGREKPHMVKYKAITNDWNYDAYITSGLELRKFQALGFRCTECTLPLTLH